MKHKTLTAAMMAGALAFSLSGAAFAEGRMSMNWGSVRTPAQAALAAAKAGNTAVYTQKLNEALSAARAMNKDQPDPDLENAIGELRKIAEQDAATSPKSLEAYLPKLKDRDASSESWTPTRWQ